MDIVTRLHDLCSREHLCTVALIEALVECDRIRAYLDHGYDSLWNLLVDGLQYSKAAASRRFEAMKCARKFPAVIVALREDRVTLSSLEAIEPLLDEIESEAALFERIAGKSFAEVKEEVGRARPVERKRESVRREFVKVEAPKPGELFVATDEAEGGVEVEAAAEAEVAAGGEAAAEAKASSTHVPVSTPAPTIEERITVTLSLTPEEFAIIEHARAIASRKPGRVPTVREALVEAARFYVAKRGPKQRAKGKASAEASVEPNPNPNTNPNPTSPSTPSPRSRHIPDAIRDAVMLRDGERCTFVAASGRRCPGTLDLHVDHIDPFSLGGPHELDNLRVMCGAHNRRRSDQTFGRRGQRSSDAEPTARSQVPGSATCRADGP